MSACYQGTAAMHGIRDSYRGVFPQALAMLTDRCRVIYVRQSGRDIELTIDDAGEARTLVVSRLDSPGLELLSAYDRAVVQSALIGLNRTVQEVGNG